MKKRVLAGILIAVLGVNLLSGCGASKKTEAPDQNIAAEEKTAAGEKSTGAGTEPLREETQAAVGHVQMDVTANHSIDADIRGPEGNSCQVYKLKYLNFDWEKVRNLLIPEDKSSFTSEKSEHMEGQVTYKTEDGNDITLSEGSIWMTKADEHKECKIGELEDLMKRYLKEHPEEETKSLDFMSKEEAVSLGKNVLKGLGMTLPAKVDVCTSMTHDRAYEYQQSLIEANNKADYHIYTSLNMDLEKSDLSNQDDLYFLQFSFSCDGIPVTGQYGEPNFAYTGDFFPPMPTSAKMCISREGIVSFQLDGAFVPEGAGKNVQIQSGEEALKAYKAEWETRPVLEEEQWRVREVYLVYLPRYNEAEKATLLLPYWCVNFEFNIENQFTGEKYWDLFGADRYNAQTLVNSSVGG